MIIVKRLEKQTDVNIGKYDRTDYLNETALGEVS